MERDKLLPARGLVFSAPMVIEILKDRKTMTRRTDQRLLSVKKGNILYVKETWIPAFKRTENLSGVIYRADGPEYNSLASQKHQWGAGYPWKSPRFMPRWAARIYLVATADAKGERLREITAVDCIKEGCPSGYIPGNLSMESQRILLEGKRDWFRETWESLHGKGSWEANESVVVLEFVRRIDGRK